MIGMEAFYDTFRAQNNERLHITLHYTNTLLLFQCLL